MKRICMMLGALLAFQLLAADDAVADKVMHDLSAVRIDAEKKPKRKIAFAVDELVYHLKLVCGSRVDQSAKFTFVFRAPSDAAPLKPFESRYRIDGSTVWFWGDNGGSEVAFDWGDNRGSMSRKRHGSLFAVYLFLENELGVKWVWPGEEGIDFAAASSPSLPAKKEASFITPLLKSEIRNYASYESLDRLKSQMAFTPAALVGDPVGYRKWSHDERELWLLRCRLQDRAFFKYGHAYTKWKDRFEKTHPEFLNWNESRRERGYTGSQGRDRTKLCVSNEAVVDQIIADWLAAGTNQYLNVCENDSAFYCECAGCRALDADEPGEQPMSHMTDRYCNLWNRIAKKARAIRPDVTLVAYAYSHYRKAPRRERVEYPDNMLFGFVPSLMDDASAEFEKWRARGMRRFFLRPNYHHYFGTIPRGLEKVIYDTFQQCRAFGMIGCDFDAPSRRAINDFEFYVTARMLVDPEKPFERIADEFYSAYGDAAPDVKRYYERVRRDGEAARGKYLALGKDQLKLLDDSELSIMQCFGREEADLVAAHELAKAAVEKWRGRLPEKFSRRLVSLEKRAADAVLTFRFLTMQKPGCDRAEFARRGDELIAERLANKEWFIESWPSVFGNWYGELRTWRRIPKYLIEVVDGGTLDPRGEKYGWSASFEARSFTKWRKGGGQAIFTDAAASKGKWAVRLAADGKSYIVNDNVRVLPGRKYRLSADLRAEGRIKGVKLRVAQYPVPEKDIKGRDLAYPVFTDVPTDSWKTYALEFIAPTNFPESRAKWGPDYVACVRALILAQGGDADAALLVDNVRLELVE